MPLSKHYKGHGEEVMANMVKQYGAEKGKRVFYATENKMKSSHMSARKKSRKGKVSNAHHNWGG